MHARTKEDADERWDDVVSVPESLIGGVLNLRNGVSLPAEEAHLLASDSDESGEGDFCVKLLRWWYPFDFFSFASYSLSSVSSYRTLCWCSPISTVKSSHTL